MKRRSTGVPALAAYLEVHARWAANNHDAFGEFAADVRRLHDRLERATGRVRKPAKAGASCFDCGGDLVRPVTDQGLEVEDVVVCQQCGASYDGARYSLALAAAVQDASRLDIDGERYGTVEAAAFDTGRSVNTIRRWLANGLLRRSSRGGVLFVSLVDAADCDAARGRRARGA